VAADRFGEMWTDRAYAALENPQDSAANLAREAIIIPHVTNLEDSGSREGALGDFTAQHGKRLRVLALDLIVGNAGCGLAGIPHL
jgi:hypothetical protein